MSGKLRWNGALFTQEISEAAGISNNQFLTNMSHEIRTPIIGILGSLDLLEASELNQQQAANISIIRECGEQLLQIADNFLELSKSKSEQIAIDLEPCNLQELCSSSVKRVEVLLRRKGLEFELYIDSLLPAKVMLDKSRVQQLIFNLLDNAIKFTPKGKVELRAKIHPADSSRLLFSISDTGIGIAPSLLNTVFEPFTQLDNSNTRQYGGTGLGLYICRNLAKLMGGEMQLESRLAIGTKASFSLPLIEAEEKLIEAPLELESKNRDDSLLVFNPTRVLLVEDNPLNQRIVGQMLHNYGFDVIMAANGLEALNILQKSPISIILMDMQMPVMDGYETTQHIRQHRKWKEIPIIAITAHSLPGDREKCLACGCSSYIAKPFKASELVQLIKEYIKQDIRESASIQHLIADLLPEFLVMLDEMIDDLETAIKNCDIDNIQATSHDIKGTAGMYGFMKLSQLAADIEQASRSKSLVEIKRVFAGLCQEVEKVKVQVS